MGLDEITTISSLPAQIKQFFNKNLLWEFLDFINDRFNRIHKRFIKKVPSSHYRRQREYQKLYKEFIELYERKKTEKANYDAEVKKKIQERPMFPATGGTVRFKRFRPEKKEPI